MPRVRSTCVARLQLACRAAPIARSRVAVVALLGAGHDSIATGLGHTAGANHRTGPSGFQLAGRAAPVATDRVAVVALFSPANLAVTTLDCGYAELAWRGTDVIGLDRALGAATIAAQSIAIVALLADVQADNTVATEFDALTHLSRGRTGPAGFGLAGRRAAVARDDVAVVAAFASPDDAVATDIRRRLRTRTAGVVGGLRAGEARLDCRTVCGAPVAGDCIAVVACLTGIHDAVATDPSLGAQDTWRRATVAGFQCANAGAAIAGRSVTVIALLAARRLDDSITAIPV